MASPTFLSELGQRVARLKELTGAAAVAELEATFQSMAKPVDASQSIESEFSEAEISLSGDDTPRDHSELHEQVQSMKRKTTQIGRLVRSQFQAFKRVNSRTFDDGLLDEPARKSVGVLADDTSCTKGPRELMESMRHSVSGHSELRLSFAEQPVVERLSELRSELDSVASRVQLRLQQIHTKEVENQLLKSALQDLQEQLNEESCFACEACRIL